MSEIVKTVQTFYGPDVTLVRTDMQGNKHYDTMPAAFAVAVLLEDPENGVKYRSGIIKWAGPFLTEIDHWSYSV